jgi:hypothetical protein
MCVNISNISNFANNDEMLTLVTKKERLVNLGLRIPEDKYDEVHRLSALLHVKPSEVARWIFDDGWKHKNAIIRSKASVLLSVLGESLPAKSLTGESEEEKER